MELTLFNYDRGESITMTIEEFKADPRNNNVVLFFMNDEEARANERLLKIKGYTTQHTDSVITILSCSNSLINIKLLK